ncbi:MAG: DUF2442 domain-containing protein [Deltaproteobacteria bacterium]|nr:DUF2442 domain-containing protein [Deltaproteobacteria bacterium]
MYAAVKDVKPLDGHRLLIRFANGEERIFDVTPYLSLGRFAELRDPSVFSSVAVKFDGIEWANHLDLDPELLYEKGMAREAI